MAFVNYVTPGYFATTRIPLVRGREFDPRDAAGSPSVAVVNETMAELFWPGEDALGKRFWFFGETQATQVVGVARDSKVGFLAENPQPLAYEPLYQDYRTFGSLIVRTAGPTPGATFTRWA